MDADEAGPGEIIALAGIPEITIGETIADLDDPRPLPVIAVEEPALGMTIGVNSSPLAGQSGSRLTARMVKDRLDQELVGNVAIRVLDTERTDTWEVQGRGELQLAVLVESMRREGFELTVGKPQVVTREVDGALHEPIERLSIDIPEDFLGVVTQMLALRKGRLENMVNHGTGLGPARLPRAHARADRLPHRVPDRDARLGHPALGLRALRALAGRDPHAADRLARGRPARPDRHVRPAQAAGARPALRGPGRGGLRGDGGGRERARRRPRRERRAREEADQRAGGGVGRDGQARARAPAVARPGARVHPRGRVRGGDARRRAAAQAHARRGGAQKESRARKRVEV